ncbi:uncharacterized protein LOC115744028 [Rhodamnia argentea]|uniref:Uncharacterized protein LOC115744028 n=1 Tax=Rhodamnia argentea TaxID=178133 RepID=A0A8B8PKQ1_9MYRT|nr:uncharacterized protein LOC115744028 [Rhodamnia argentea]
MATRSANMKGFFKQKKNTKSTSSNKGSSKRSPTASTSSDVTQPPALISHGSLDLKGDHDHAEEVLRQFDMNMAYGPCLGMTRLSRWERAQKLGLNPPNEVEILLKGGRVSSECLWDGRV